MSIRLPPCIRCLLEEEPLTFAARLGVVLILITSPFLACVSAGRAVRPSHQARVETEGERREKSLTGRSDDAGVPPADLLVPEKPDSWMKKPPCNTGMDEELVNGACWQGTRVRPPCGELYKWGNNCYRPLEQPKKKPISGE